MRYLPNVASSFATPNDRRWAQKAIVIAFAGPAAEAHFAGFYNFRGSFADFDKAMSLAYRRRSRTDTFLRTDAYLCARERAAMRLVTNNWSAVEAVAQALLRRRALAGDEIVELVRGRAQQGLSASRRA
jgi:hypothetical protein